MSRLVVPFDIKLVRELYEALVDTGMASPDLVDRASAALAGADVVDTSFDPRREVYAPDLWYVIISPDLDYPDASELTGPLQGRKVVSIVEVILGDNPELRPAEVEVYPIEMPAGIDITDCALLIDHAADAEFALMVFADAGVADAERLACSSCELIDEVDLRAIPMHYHGLRYLR